jgi:hypothetical protein
LRHWQIEEFLRQTGKADNTQRTYRRQAKLVFSFLFSSSQALPKKKACFKQTFNYELDLALAQVAI